MVWIPSLHRELWQVLVNKKMNLRVQMSPPGTSVRRFVKNVMFPSSGRPNH